MKRKIIIILLSIWLVILLLITPFVGLASLRAGDWFSIDIIDLGHGYYIQPKDEDGAAVEGPVKIEGYTEKIAWNDKLILSKQEEGDYWIIDINKGSKYGPLSLEKFESLKYKLGLQRNLSLKDLSKLKWENRGINWILYLSFCIPYCAILIKATMVKKDREKWLIVELIFIQYLSFGVFQIMPMFMVRNSIIYLMGYVYNAVLGWIFFEVF
ncbi:MAG: hypothetical protein ACM3UU_07020 [Ignavibacteriales bacterium]